VLRTRSPRARTLYCYRVLRVRLACVKHAASVRSEPGSNSHLKLVSRCPQRGIGTNSRTRSVFLKWPSFRYTRNKSRNQTGSGLYHPIVKERILPGRLEGLRTNADSTHHLPESQALNLPGKQQRESRIRKPILDRGAGNVSALPPTVRSARAGLRQCSRLVLPHAPANSVCVATTVLRPSAAFYPERNRWAARCLRSGQQPEPCRNCSKM
jgi:hypothetical protein